MAKLFLSEREVTEVYGIGCRQLRRHRMRGDGPPWRKTSGAIGRRGGRVLYPVADLEAWLASRPGGGEEVR